MYDLDKLLVDNILSQHKPKTSCKRFNQYQKVSDLYITLYVQQVFIIRQLSYLAGH